MSEEKMRKKGKEKENRIENINITFSASIGHTLQGSAEPTESRQHACSSIMGDGKDKASEQPSIT